MTARSTRLLSLALPGLALLALAGCGEPRDRGSPGLQAACRERAEEVYLRQNRAEIYRDDHYASSTRDAPFGSSGVVGNTSSGLSGRYARENMVSDCINGATASSAPAAATPDPAAAPPPPPPPPGRAPRPPVRP